jgi:hypothetical protein
LRSYYTKRLPDRAAAIAKVQARPSTARDLVDLFSAPVNPGALTAKPYPVGTAVDAAVLGNTILITGSEKYLLENLEITNQVDDTGGALYYRHRLPNTNLQAVTITDLAGNVVKDGWVLRNGDILHSFKGEAYWVSYYEKPDGAEAPADVHAGDPPRHQGSGRDVHGYGRRSDSRGKRQRNLPAAVHRGEWISGDNLLRNCQGYNLN